MKFEWQEIFTGKMRETHRAKVFNGWIVRHREMWDGEGECLSMVFVPDPNHEWKIT